MPESARVVVIGGGHNGLVCAAYLARAGANVEVLERRPLLGGSCVTEELWPGFRVSRAAYVLGLFRPRIVRELELERRGLALIPRAPSSFTPLPDGRSLLLGPDRSASAAEIAKFSDRDASAYADYELRLERVAASLEPLLDRAPPSLRLRRLRDLAPWLELVRSAVRLGRVLPHAARLLLGPARSILEEWFESEPLRATLATDAVIGAFAPPSAPGTGYVLLHHVMATSGGYRGVWAYVRGGMGALAEALADAARSAGARLRTDCEVTAIQVGRGRARGVVLTSGEEIRADIVASSADPVRTLLHLVDPCELPAGVAEALRALDLRSPVVKINLTLGELPRFRAIEGEPRALHGTIHAGCADLDALERAYDDARRGDCSLRPMLELTIPSLLDSTLAPPGRHVASIFAQYAPALDASDARWPELRARMRDRALAALDDVAPGFSRAVLDLEVLAAPELERIFGLTAGNIFHGAMTPDRLHFLRPLPGWRYGTPIRGLYLCGAGTHPGGGVMGAPGRNAAREIARELARARTRAQKERSASPMVA